MSTPGSAEKLAVLYQIVEKYRLHMNMSFTAKGNVMAMSQTAKRHLHYVTLHTDEPAPEIRVSFAGRNRPTAEEALNDVFEYLVKRLPNEELLHAYRSTSTHVG